MIEPTSKRRKLNTNSTTNMDTTDDGDWKPPTEAERKIMEAKRERSNKISQLMGTYLLKGHKMLATHCSSCATIMMRNKEGNDYCVACTELSTDVGKDDPAVSTEAAQRQVAEDQQRTPTTTTAAADMEVHEDHPDPPQSFDSALYAAESLPPPPSYVLPRQMPADSATTTSSSQAGNTSGKMTVTNSIVTVQDKLHWASEQLKNERNPDACIQWCKVIQHCADSMFSLYTVKSKIH